MISILIPSIPQRLDRLKELIVKYESYISLYNVDAEIISVVDNKKMSIGEKRNALVDLSRGDYWVMTDDDLDELTEKYFALVPETCIVDVVTYLQLARINHQSTTVEFGLRNINEDFIPDGVTKRKAWHCCTWKKEKIRDARFNSYKNWGEDSFFADIANELADNTIHIPEICHIYQHDSKTTAAFQ